MPLPWILLGAPSSAHLSHLLSIFVLRVIEAQKGGDQREGGGWNEIKC